MSETNEILEFDFAEISDDDFQLHLQHHGIDQPNNITGQDQLRSKGVVLCGRLVEAVHGNMKIHESSGLNQGPRTEPCTLAIFEWYVHTSKPGYRIKFACIDITFASSNLNVNHNPWVANCAPWGSYSLFETSRTLETTKSWQPTIKLGQEGVVTAESPLVYGLTETVERKEQIHVDGCPVLPKDGSYSHPDRFSAVRWNLFENKSQESGIPRYFRTAVLLNRAEGKDGKFTAAVEIKVKVSKVQDTIEKVRGFLGRNVKDDPLTFNPTLGPKTNRFVDMTGDLGEDGVNLDDEMGFLLFKNQGAGAGEA
ncbi:hypothetical protein CEP52_014629 [Fusarium oligoseptatum]|uniref:Uncharacterized protein n=1 Tax=Fusarium oligoseptatum TaxID=2604345 RepID=A0A428SKG7_9HYPO|nr:hypothetical protein CEP52_014629 [Fusarium oligoseptatum]